uniref:C-type lectin domain-containing protein n=1 Tax=Laticauda laticaudata TaxID=8630 RepID=A0A8C5SHV0_LATLA
MGNSADYLLLLLKAKAASCPRNWLQKQGNCYGYFDEKLSWDDAEFECQTFGPGCHLASILSIQESALMSVYIKNKQQSRSHVWIGLRDISGLFFSLFVLIFIILYRLPDGNCSKKGFPG